MINNRIYVFHDLMEKTKVDLNTNRELMLQKLFFNTIIWGLDTFTQNQLIKDAKCFSVNSHLAFLDVWTKVWDYTTHTAHIHTCPFFLHLSEYLTFQFQPPLVVLLKSIHFSLVCSLSPIMAATSTRDIVALPWGMSVVVRTWTHTEYFFVTFIMTDTTLIMQWFYFNIRCIHAKVFLCSCQAQRNERESIRQKLALGSFYDDEPVIYTSCSKNGPSSR